MVKNELAAIREIGIRNCDFGVFFYIFLWDEVGNLPQAAKRAFGLVFWVSNFLGITKGDTYASDIEPSAELVLEFEQFHQLLQDTAHRGQCILRFSHFDHLGKFSIDLESLDNTLRLRLTNPRGLIKGLKSVENVQLCKVGGKAWTARGKPTDILATEVFYNKWIVNKKQHTKGLLEYNLLYNLQYLDSRTIKYEGITTSNTIYLYKPDKEHLCIVRIHNDGPIRGVRHAFSRDAALCSYGEESIGGLCTYEIIAKTKSGELPYCG